MKPSVLIVHNKYIYQGGEEKIIQQQMNQLLKNGHRVEAYFENSADFKNRSLVQKLSNALQMPFSYRHYRGLQEKIRTFRPDVVHFHNVFPLLTPSVYYAAKKEKMAVVQSVHNYRFMCSNGLFLLPGGTVCEKCLNGCQLNGFINRCYGNSFARSFAMSMNLWVHRKMNTFKKNIDFFIAPSQFLKGKLIEGGIPEQKIVQIPAGISVAPTGNGIQEDKRAVFVGRLSVEKGLFTLLEAASRLPDWKFDIVGDGPLNTALKNTVETKKLSNVNLRGQVPSEQVRDFLQRATCLVLPSECYENLPTVVLEAWAFGIPTVVSKMGGMAELVKDGVNGLLFTPKDPSSLVDRLKSFGLKESRAMKEGITAHFKNNYQADLNYQRTMKIYSEALSVVRSAP